MKRLFLLILLTACSAQVTFRGTVKCSGTCRINPTGVGVVLQSISVSPSNPTITIGSLISFTALGTYSDGSTADVTGASTWTSSNGAIATNVANAFTCVSGGSSTAQAQISGIVGTTTLTCQALTISPTGTLTAIQSVAFSQQFTATGGTPAYTFTSSDIASLSPAWLTLTSGGILSGTTASLGDYNFHITATDSLSHATTIPIAVQVITVQAEDNRYCLSNETVTGLSTDGPAAPMQFCNYTTIASTPSPGSVLYACPTNQTLANGSADPNCNPSATPPYYNSVQAAMNAAQCGQSVQVYPTRGAGIQNVYNENLVPLPTSCYGDVRGWITVETSAFASLPPPGTRITPAWAGQTSLPGRPSYIQPTVPGIYLPMIRCTYAGPTCQPLGTPLASAGMSGWRFIGIEFSAPHGREPTGGTPAGLPNVAVCENNFNGTPQCSPGYTNPLVSIGCTNFPASSCGATGATHVILDRILVHSCDDKSDTTCLDQGREGIEMQGGQHNSLIDSYIYGFKTLSGIGPTVEGHGMGGGNDRNTADDGPHKVVNNFLEGSSMSFFWGGGGSTSGVFSYDVEIRRNRMWKPLLWKLDDPSFPQFGGAIQDTWVNTKGSGYTNGNPGSACTMTAPTGPNPVQATCHTIVSGGQIKDVIIDNPGSGYTQHPKFTFADGTGAKAFPLDGILNIKNCFEFKNGKRVLVEGNICENIWKGQSDQEAFCVLLTPKNANDACPTCTVQDATLRYNVCKNSNRGMQLGTEAASQCTNGPICLPDTLARISIHDMLIDGVNPKLWISQSGAFDGFGGGIFVFQNANPQAKAIQDVTINHITAITTSPAGSGSSSLASCMALGYTPKNTSAVFSGITLTNSICAGGVKATAQISNGGFNCSSAGCSGGSVTALSGMAASTNLLPISGGLYTTGQVMVGTVTAGGTCTVAPSSCSFTGGGGSGATCGLRFSGGAVTTVYPSAVGTGYTSAPAVAFSGGTCSVTPTATATIGGIGIGSTKSWCNDHNLWITAGFNGEVPMTPYPSQQGDSTNNTCVSHGGGGNLTVNTWNDVLFVNYLVDGSGSEIPTGDLHLQVTSPGHNTASDGTDMGANMDLVLGKSDGTSPSPYTGITISNGLQVLPQ